MELILELSERTSDLPNLLIFISFSNQINAKIFVP